MYPRGKLRNRTGLEAGMGVLCLSILPEGTDLNLGGKDNLPRCVTGRQSEERKIKTESGLEIRSVHSKIYKFGIAPENLSARKSTWNYSKTS